MRCLIILLLLIPGSLLFSAANRYAVLLTPVENAPIETVVVSPVLSLRSGEAIVLFSTTSLVAGWSRQTQVRFLEEDEWLNLNIPEARPLGEIQAKALPGPLDIRVVYIAQPSAEPGEHADVFFIYAPQGDAPQATSSNIVIPTDSPGDVSILLEASDDLVNWNAALPGTYSASGGPRFFRLRAVSAH